MIIDLTWQERRKVLSDPEACEKTFDFEIDPQNIAEAVEFLTDLALQTDDEDVKLPVSLAAAAVLMLKGLVKRPRGSPRDSYRQRREKTSAKLGHRLRKDPPRDSFDPMIVWARARKAEIQAAAKSKLAQLAAEGAEVDEDTKTEATAPGATEKAAKQARTMFGSRLSWQEIANRMRRPGRYATRRG